MKLDLKSALLGLAVGIGAVLAMGAGDSSPGCGRYQTASSAGVFIIVDTDTGKVWYSNLQRPGFLGETGGFWEKKLDR